MHPTYTFEVDTFRDSIKQLELDNVQLQKNTSSKHKKEAKNPSLDTTKNYDVFGKPKKKLQKQDESMKKTQNITNIRGSVNYQSNLYELTETTKVKVEVNKFNLLETERKTEKVYLNINTNTQYEDVQERSAHSGKHNLNLFKHNIKNLSGDKTLVCHVKTHTDKKPLEGVANKSSNTSNVKKHLKYDYNGWKPFACELCDYKCFKNSDLVKHMRIHTGEKPFACDICKYKCTVKSSLVSHIKKHTGEKGESPFACKLCEFKSSRKSALVIHMRKHTGEKPFACDICQYKCSKKCNLVRHMVKHTGEKRVAKRVACKLCEYKCSARDTLLCHMRKHTGEKPFACSICEQKFAWKAVLVRHMRSHTGEKPFVCSICQWKFSWKYDLVRHLRTHTGEKPFSCSTCQYKCSRKVTLVRHMRIHHSVLI